MTIKPILITTYYLQAELLVPDRIQGVLLDGGCLDEPGRYTINSGLYSSSAPRHSSSAPVSFNVRGVSLSG